MGSHECNICPHNNNNHHHHHRHCPLHHHRHHHDHRHCPHCPLHSHHCHRNFQSLPYLTPLPHNPLPLATHPISHYNNEANTQISQELEHIELDDEEQDDDPVFVLTDEWREFFAKSEARRKLEKQQQSKKGKK